MNSLIGQFVLTLVRNAVLQHELNSTVLYTTVLCTSVLYNTILYLTILYCTSLYLTIMYCNVIVVLYWS